MLTVTDYTKAAKPLLQHLSEKFPNGICVSDIQDTLGRQYVDLVQEGGGVHGIALAGYTYVLESMGISFMKMAGTSAGSINTLLLNAVYTKEEARLLDVKGEYYETRSEKVLEYLSEKDLKDFVDGPALWRKLILWIFSPSFKQKGIKGILAENKRFLVADGVTLILLIIAGFGLIYSEGGIATLFRWIFYISFISMVLISVLLYLRIRYAGQLYKLIEKFGINPGANFEKWIVDILKENGLITVGDLTQKFEKEKVLLKPRYIPCHRTSGRTQSNELTTRYNKLLEQIENPDVKVELLYMDLCEIYHSQGTMDSEHIAFWQEVIRSFEKRLAKDPVVTKEMVIVSSDITHGLKVEFPGMHKMYWGNDTQISPARYVRASMSVPFFFRPMDVKFEEREAEAIRSAWSQILKVQNKLENHALFVDGGLLSNFPINVFYSSTMPVPRKPTFGIKLEYENDIDSRTIRNFMEFGGSMINTMRYYYDRDFALKQDIYKKTVRSIDTGKVHWLNFNLTDEEKLELFFRGALTATIFLSKYINTNEEINKLEKLGTAVSINNSTFSIYNDEAVQFKTEDKMLENITFEWQAYKLERLFDRLAKEGKKNELKGGAALQNLTTS